MKLNRFAVAALAIALLSAAAASAQSTAATQDRWLHVRVTESGEKNENVRVNLPLALAEAILPTLKINHLDGGRVKIDHHHRIHDVDFRAIWEAVRKSPDGEFVTVQSTKDNVRVAKQAGYMIVHVTEEKDATNKDPETRVDVKVPLTVVEALMSGANKDELDLLAGIRALAKHGDAELVTVKDRKTTVRVWVDSKSTAE